MRNSRARSLILLALLLPLPARAALTPVGSPQVVFEAPSCSARPSVEVIATPPGAFDVVWSDDDDAKVLGQRFARDLTPTGSPATLMTLHGGLFITDLLGAWTGRYQLAINGIDFGDHPDNPATGYRVSMNLAGNPLGPPLIVRAGDFFVKLAPAAGGDSLLLRAEPPIFGPVRCQSFGLLARRIDEHGAPLGPENRVGRKASAVAYGAGFQSQVERLPDDTFLLVYPTCEKFTGLVVRHLNASGAPVGNPINLTLPALPGNFSIPSLSLAARGANDFAVAGSILDTRNPAINGTYTRAVADGQSFGPTRLAVPAALTSTIALDLAASPAGRYLLLFQGPKAGDTGRVLVFAQELDAHGAPLGSPVQVAEANGSNLGPAAAVASLPGGRWAVATQEQNGESSSCDERVVVTLLESH